MDTVADYQAWKARRQQAGVGAAQIVLDSVEGNPDEVAGDLNLANEFGKVTGNPVPPLPMVKEYRNVFQRKIEEQRNSTTLSGAPKLADWLRNPENAALSRDDLKRLAWFERFGIEGQKQPDISFGQGLINSGRRGIGRLDQMGSQFMLEQAAGRAADRDRSFGEILQDAKANSGLRDMQGNPIETWTGGEYLSAFGRWIDARYADLIGADDEAAAADFAARVQESRDAIAAIPKSHIAQQFEGEAMIDGASFGEALANFGMAFLSNPLGGISWALETAGESAPQLTAAAATTVLTRNPVAGAAVGGAGSYATERYTSPAEFLEEKGVDLSNPEDVQRLISDPTLMKEAASRGVIRGLVIGAFDIASMGVAGRALAGNPMVEAIAQGASQAVIGSAGEFTARVAAGQEIDWNEVIAEGLAEIATAPVDMGIAGRKFIRQRRGAERAAEGMQFKDVDALTRTLAEARARRDAGIDRRGMSLLEFIDDHGGINDPGGELRARDAEVIKRGRGKKTLRLSRGRMAAVRDMFGGSGKKFGLDDVAQAAIEAGYMADNPIVAEYQNAVREGREVPNIGNALLEAIDRELRGEPQFSSTAPVDQAAIDTDAALEGIDAYLSQLGVGLDDDDATIRAAVEADQDEGRQYSQAAADVSKDLGVWRGKLADLFRGKLPDSADLRVGNVPAVLRALGVRSGQMVFRGSKIRRVIREHADVRNSSLLNLPALLADPALVYEEVSKESDLIVVTDNVSATGAPVVVAIKSEGTTNNEQRATVVLTVYPLDRGNEKLAEIEAAGRILYLRDKEVGARFELTGANSLKGLRTQPPSRRPARKILSAEDVFKGKAYKQPGDDRGARGSIQFPRDGVGNGDSVIRLFQTADLSTMLHESGHYFLTVMQDIAARGEEGAAADVAAVKDWWRKNAAEVARDGARAVPDAKLSADDVIAVLDAGSTGDLVKDAAVDVGMQEQWARAFEAYLMEGKAPSVELRGAFEKFRAWLISIYRRLAGLNVRPSEELRAVFDRMLATDNEIAEARERSGGMEAALPSAEAMGLSQEEYDRFLKLRAKAEDESKARLLKEIMAPIKREREKWYKDERAKVREEVEREVNAARYFRAIEWMGNRRWIGEGKPEQMPDIRLSKDILVQRYGAGILDTLPRGRQTIYAVEGGVDPDDVAGWFGFDSGDEMVRAMETAPKRVEAIEAETDKRMRELHGDVLRDGEVEAVALDAVHSERHTEWVAAELKAIAEVAGVDVALTAKEARHTARQTISRMRVRDAMASNRFLAAERRAGEEAARLGAMLAREAVWMNNARRRIAIKARAAMRGDGTVDAPARQIEQANRSTANYNETVGRLIEAKRRQLLNHALYMEARKAAEEVQTAERYVAGLSRKAKREQIAGAGRREKAQIDYLSAIDELLERYDFRKLSGRAEERRGALNAFVERMKAEGRENQLAIPESVLSDAARRPYKTLAVEELRGVVDTLKNLEHMALRWNELIEAQKARELEAVTSEIAEAFEKNMPKRPPGRVGSRSENFRAAARQTLNAVLNAGTILREIDGFEDFGPAYRNIKSPIDEAMNRLIVRKEKAANDLDALYSVYTKDERRRMAVREHVPVLGYALSKWEKIAIALNAGNEGNFQRLTDSRVRGSLAEVQVNSILASLDQRDADFVQSVWDYLETFRDDIAARERRTTGVEPKWVEARPVMIGGKMLRGGYYPLRYDPRLSSLARDDQAHDIAQSLQAGRFGKAQTRNGHLKARENSSGRDVELDMSVLHKHVNQVIYDLELSEAVSNSWRILQNGSVRSAFMEAGRQVDFDTLEAWLKDVAEGELKSADIVSRSARMLKSNFTAAKLAFNLSTVAVQVTGLPQSMVVVGKKNMAKAIAQTVASPFSKADEIAAKSAFMKSRQTTFNKDIYDMFNDPKIGPVATRWNEARNHIAGKLGLWLMTKVQFYLVDAPTWLAGYNQGMAKFGNDEAKAIAHADAVVKRAQASGLFPDRSAVERGTLSKNTRQNDVVRLFTALGSYMFAKFNVAYERSMVAGRTIREEGASLRGLQEALSWTLDMAFLFTVEAVLYAAIKGRLPDDDDEDDGWLKFLAKETGLSVMSTIPFVRDVGSTLSGFEGGGAYGAITKEIAAPFLQLGQGEADKPLVKSIINAAGLATGMPSSQFNRFVDAVLRQADGEDVSPFEYLLGKIGK